MTLGGHRQYTEILMYPLTCTAGTADDNLSSLSSLFKALSGFAQEYFCTLVRSDTAVLIPQNQQKQALEFCSVLQDSFEQIINSKIVAVELHASIQYARRPLSPTRKCNTFMSLFPQVSHQSNSKLFLRRIRRQPRSSGAMIAGV